MFTPFISLSLALAICITLIKTLAEAQKEMVELEMDCFVPCKIMCTSLHIIHRQNVNLKNSQSLTLITFLFIRIIFIRIRSLKKMKV